MKTKIIRLLHCVLLIAALPVCAQHPFLCTDSAAGKVCVVSSDGKIEWEYACTHPQDCWRLPNGNYLFCHSSGALEMTPDKKTAWEYKAGANTEVHACQPLRDGRVLLVECGPCRLLEIDRDGKIAKEIKLTPPPATVKLHDQFRGVRKTKDGHYLVCRKGEHIVQELDADGKSLREIKVPGDVHEAVLLPDGHLLIDCGDGHKVVELDADEKVVWELNENDLPGNPLRLMAGCQRLPNGNTVFCNYIGHGHLGEQPHVFEITRDKKIVWQFADQTHFKTINQIQLLDVPGDVTKGEILR
jgi:outer membrane protein assembly factor BamB